MCEHLDDPDSQGQGGDDNPQLTKRQVRLLRRKAGAMIANPPAEPDELAELYQLGLITSPSSLAWITGPGRCALAANT